MSLSRDTRVRYAAGAVLVATFTGGLALGFALDRGVAQVAPERAAREDRRRVDPGPPPNEWIIDRLEMGADQRARVDSLLGHFGAQISVLQREYRPRFEAVVDSANRSLRELLTEDQILRYDSLEAEQARRRGRGNPPGRR
jgi:hypothetical protein